MKRLLLVFVILCLAVPSPARLRRRTPTTQKTPTITRLPTMTRTPTATLAPETLTMLCRADASTLVRRDPALVQSYYDVLMCLGWTEVYHTSYYPVCWSDVWINQNPRPMPCNAPRTLLEGLRTVRLSTSECPQAVNVWCCHDYANNWCDCTPGSGPMWNWCDCDGIYLADFGSGPGPRRVAGTTIDCPTGPVIVVPASCSSGHDAWRHELIHLLRKEMGDPNWMLNDGFEGWRCQ